MIFSVRSFLNRVLFSIIFVTNVFSRILFKIFFLFFSLQPLAQKESVLKVTRHDSNEPKMDTITPGFIKIAADPQLKGNSFQKFLAGENYRREWVEPVGVSVLNLNTAKGGLVPEKLAGGKQTKSLRVKDSAGREWAFRSVEKFPEKGIPPELRKTIAEKIVKDGISASYPYRTLSMSVFSKAINVPFLKDTLVYIANDPALGEFRSRFKNILVLMEEKEPSGVITENDPSSIAQEGKKEKTINTEELVYVLANYNNNKVDQLTVLRARLLDNFVMDFDRMKANGIGLVLIQRPAKFITRYPLTMTRSFIRARAYYQNW
jgi:hypothetical protein